VLRGRSEKGRGHGEFSGQRRRKKQRGKFIFGSGSYDFISMGGVGPMTWTLLLGHSDIHRKEKRRGGVRGKAGGGNVC